MGIVKNTKKIVKNTVNVRIFKKTQALCSSDPDISSSIIRTQNETRFISSEQVNDWRSVRESEQPKYEKTKVSFSHDKTFTAAGRFARNDNHVAVLNFANAGTPGGGVVYGAVAQEEDLCRSSNLYPVISSRFGVMPQFYEDGLKQRKEKTPMNAAVMYHPGIIVFRSDMENYRIFRPEERFSVDVITCAAPNLRFDNSFSDDDQRAFHLKEGRVILDLALQNHAEVVILGAFGCGAFRNDPEIVAKVYHDLTKEYDGYFKELHFAIFGEGVAKRNYSIFKESIVEQ